MEPKKHYFAHIPSIFIFILFAMSAPLGVLLFILKCIDKNAEKEEKTAAGIYNAYNDLRSQKDKPEDVSWQAAPEPATGHDMPTREQRDAKELQKFLTTLCTIGGGIFLLIGFSTMFLAGPATFAEGLTATTQMLGGGAALLTGLRMKRTHDLELLLDKIVGDRDNIPLKDLFAAAGIEASQGYSVVDSAIAHGYFGANAYVDYRTDTLVVRGAAPQPK